MVIFVMMTVRSLICDGVQFPIVYLFYAHLLLANFQIRWARSFFLFVFSSHTQSVYGWGLSTDFNLIAKHVFIFQVLLSLPRLSFAWKHIFEIMQAINSLISLYLSFVWRVRLLKRNEIRQLIIFRIIRLHAISLLQFGRQKGEKYSEAMKTMADTFLIPHAHNALNRNPLITFDNQFIEHWTCSKSSV